MERLDIARLLTSATSLRGLLTLLMGSPEDKPALFSSADYEKAKSEVDFIKSETKRLDLSGSFASASRLSGLMEKHVRRGEAGMAPDSVGLSSIDKLRVIEEGQLLIGGLADNISVRIVLVVPGSKAKYYNPDEPLFGAQVDEKFKKKARLEISEAGKCLALGRPTACVFHLMRTVEVAIEAIRLCLGLGAPTKGQHKAWGAATGAFQAEIDKRNEDRAWPRQWTALADKKFFEQAQMSLIAIKDGCRDSTMHVESVYTEDEATHLLALTKGFMQMVASRLDEDGQPLA